MQTPSLLVVNPNRFQNEEVQRVLADNGCMADCTETCFGAELRLAARHQDYLLLVCSNILLDAPAGLFIERVWNHWRIPTLPMVHHFPLQQICREPEWFRSPDESLIGAIEVPCSDDAFVETVTDVLQRARQRESEGANRVGATMASEESWKEKPLSQKFAMTLLEVGEMIEQGKLSCEHGGDEIWPFVRDMLWGIEPPPELTEAMKRISFLSDEAELRSAVHREALRAMGMVHDKPL